jgi:hypothetical protein
VTTRDIGQKLEMRRVLSAFGASTRLEVKLGALIRGQRSRADREEWTDVDVLAVDYSPFSGLTVAIADCKTSRGRVAERIFWLRGVMDLIQARQAYLVRDEEMSPSARQLALRLGISALSPADRAALVKEAGVDTSNSRVPAFLTAEGVDRHSALLRSAPKELDRLMQYRETGFWLAPGHRALTSMPAAIRSAREHLRPDRPWALPLIADLSWLYLFACTRALVDVATLHLGEPSDGLAHVVIGDERERRDKEFLASQLKRVFAAVPKRSGPMPSVDVVPPFYEDLSDLMLRLMRRRALAVQGLRALEFATVEAAQPRASRSITPTDVDAFAWKLASDTVRFLVRASSLEIGLLESFDDLYAREQPIDARDAIEKETSPSDETPRDPVQDQEGRGQISLFNERTRSQDKEETKR